MDVKLYLQNYARKVDLRLYEHLFEGASSQPVLDELAAYQNADGGFGHALEPDVRLPDSSVLATIIAFQYLARIKATANNEVVAKAIRYLVDSYDKNKNGWTNIPPEADNYPRAPWWNYARTLEWADWGNPSAEVLGYLLHYSALVNNNSLLQKLTEQAVKRLQEITEPEQHEIKCYIRLYERASKELQAALHDLIAAAIKKITKTDPKDWEGYATTPLTFIDSPHSAFASVLDPQLVLKDVQRLRAQMVDGSHWLPTWEWGQYEQDWAKAKQDWSGRLTVENLAVLKAFESL